MQRLRSIDKAYEYIRTEDPDTCISKYLFRQMVTNGQIPCIKAGNRRLVDIDQLNENIQNVLQGGKSSAY